MLRDFKRYWLPKQVIIYLWLLLGVAPLQAQQLVYDLRQDWVYFNEDNQSFLPVEEQDLSLKSISFRLRDAEMNQFYLTIALKEKAYLFYRTKLIATLPAGSTSLKIDSLKNSIQTKSPFLTIYGDELLPELLVQVLTSPVESKFTAKYQPIKFANDFSNFFYFIATLIIGFFVILKTRFPELTEQYFLFYRAIRMKTLDEIIYKINFIAFPNILFISFIGLIFGLVIISYMYFYPAQLSILNLNPEVSSFQQLLLGWVQLSVLSTVLILFKYLLTVLVSSIFALKTASIHFASFLRLLMGMAVLLLLLIFTQHTIFGLVPEFVYWIVLLAGLLAMEVILYFKLTLATTHTLLYIILYLCATEIIPIVLLTKYITE